MSYLALSEEISKDFMQTVNLGIENSEEAGVREERNRLRNGWLTEYIIHM